MTTQLYIEEYMKFGKNKSKFNQEMYKGVLIIWNSTQLYKRFLNSII
jgi:hypothetical protein